MNKMVLMIKKSPVFFLGFVIMLFAGAVFLLVDGKSYSFILLNSYHVGWLNNFFISYTFVGNGLFAICLAAVYFLLVKKKKEAFLIFNSFLLSGIIVQVMKHLFFSPRPKLFFGAGHHSFFIDGIQFYCNNSFPSGHTTTAFTMATVLVLLSKDKKVQLPVLIAAVLVGYSRIYLGQHFLLDVLMGASIGVISGISCVHFSQRYNFTGRPFKQLFNLKSQSSVTSPGPIQSA